ncbi:hypothetical protein CAPTEDRAFT_176337 [Capitella teleta]|uniref:Uncharacterized protein n=1 Tax=Capitella teleta TaxID=283909 RepID=R7VGF4_CAPTE|nr:hypothetical protein CAPTEDRAFT_176337 [Capitella teleta]|eukprot:ELU15396.1 hypothetical protein CAPTEDRAFT_176337 [Capitella teleta]
MERLLLGDIDDVSRPEKLVSLGVSHLLTLDRRPLPLADREAFTYKFVHALDMENVDLLSKISACVEFIESGRTSGGTVMVHCQAGQSRSAAVVLAYVMQKLDLSLEDAMTLVRKQRPQIGPNEGFMRQLELFEVMGNKVDLQSNHFKVYRLNLIAEKIQEGGDLAEVFSQLSTDPSQQPASDPHAVVYKCKKCRRLLFRHTSVMPHEVGVGDAAFDWRRKETASVEGASCTQSLFVEPVLWMQRDILTMEGKIGCPKCNAKLGSFNWFGERCPCGTWVTPAIHIQSNKVDKSQPRAPLKPP